MLKTKEQKLNNKTVANKKRNIKKDIVREKGITLIALVITIIVLIILAGVAISLTLGNNGIFQKAKEAKEKTNKQTATEIIGLKITTAQTDKYADEQRMLTLKELSEILKIDDEIEYVTETTQVASKKYEVGENPSLIYTKLNKYPYEFEINSSLQLVNTKQLNYLPINNYETLMELAGIQSNFNNINELISDSAALEKVFESNEATQYILKSNELLNAIGNSQTAMQNIANSEKLMYKLIKNDKLRDVILNSSYSSLIDNASIKVSTLNNDDGKTIYSSCMNGYPAWKSFDDNNDSIWRPVHGESFPDTYIGYNFGENLICYKIGIMLKNGIYGSKTRQATFESSIDGNNWSKLIDAFSITTSNTETYYYYPTNMNVGKYFRFKGVSGDTLQAYGQYGHDVGSLQFYCVKVVND